ncbi:hypothetical protein CUMW_198880, partial [Citrus unshiu]
MLRIDIGSLSYEKASYSRGFSKSFGEIFILLIMELFNSLMAWLLHLKWVGIAGIFLPTISVKPSLKKL